MQIVGDVGQRIPEIYATLDNRQTNHQASIIEMEESWLVYLATWTKERVHHWVRAYAFELNGMPTSTRLNVLPLGSYSIIFVMD